MNSCRKYFVLLCSLIVGTAPLLAQPPLAPPPNLESLLKKANVNGKYGMLLSQVYAPADAATVGNFADQSHQPAGNIGQIAVPNGYRVYAEPYWFVWRDQKMAKRSWGPEQLTGEPDTLQAGDVQTAWASKTQDDQDEWLLLEYDAPFLATSVTIYETHHPGAVGKITVFGLDGKEEQVWAGQDNPPDGTIFVNQKNFPRAVKTNRVKVYLDSKRVTGWNEIDAVGLTDKAGQVHWATNAEASSTYADRGIQHGLRVPGGPNADMTMLLQQLRQMQIDINELRQRAGLPPRDLTQIPQAAPNLDVFLGGIFVDERAAVEAPQLTPRNAAPNPPQDPKLIPK